MKLQDIPEDILQQIMLSQLPRQGVLRIPDLKRSAQARIFASLHPEFYQAYRDSFRSVHGIYAKVPGQRGNFVFYGSLPLPIQREIPILANMIGSRLKVLQIPQLQPDVQRRLLLVIPERCSRIEELHFSDQETPHLCKLLVGLPKIRVLQVTSPSEMLFAILISKGIQLEEITFESSPENSLRHLQAFLRTCGGDLRKIAFMECAANSALYSDRLFLSVLHRWSYKIEKWTPSLSSLEISIPTTWSLTTLMIALKISGKLIARITQHCQLEISSGLERKVFPKDHGGLSGIDSLLSLKHELVAFLQEASCHCGNSSYALWRGQPKSVEVFYEDLMKLMNSKKLAEKTRQILLESSQTVTEIISVGYVVDVRHHVRMLKYYGQLLPNVSKLTVSSYLVSDAPSMQYLKLVFSDFKKLRALHLIELDYVGNQTSSLFYFLKRFPDLAETVERECSLLETLTIQKPRCQPSSHRVPQLQDLIAAALRRLDRLEDTLPNLDASAVRVFLDHWWGQSQGHGPMQD